MAGLAAARELTATRRRARPRFDLALATAADDAAVRALLREHPFAGAIRVTLEREPSALAAGGIEGDTHQLIVARDRSSGDLAAIGSRAPRNPGAVLTGSELVGRSAISSGRNGGGLSPAVYDSDSV